MKLFTRGPQTAESATAYWITHAFCFCTHLHARFEQFNKKYLRRFLIREDQQAHSILRVYQELERRGQRGDDGAPSV